MLLRILLIAIAIYFLYRFLDSLFYKQRKTNEREEYSPSNKENKKYKKDEGEYVDYEDIK